MVASRCGGFYFLAPQRAMRAADQRSRIESDNPFAITRPRLFDRSWGLERFARRCFLACRSASWHWSAPAL